MFDTYTISETERGQSEPNTDIERAGETHSDSSEDDFQSFPPWTSENTTVSRFNTKKTLLFTSLILYYYIHISFEAPIDLTSDEALTEVAVTQQVMNDSLEALPVALSSPEAPPYSPLTPPTWYEDHITIFDNL